MSLFKTEISILVILLCPIFLFSQLPVSEIDTIGLQEELKNLEDKEVTVIGDNLSIPGKKSCSQKAIRICVDGIIVDTCYSFKTREISEDIKLSLMDNGFYIDLLRVDNDKLVMLQTELNMFKKDECEESSRPYIVVVKDHGNESTYGLRRMLNCFPANEESFMKSLDVLINSIP